MRNPICAGPISLACAKWPLRAPSLTIGPILDDYSLSFLEPYQLAAAVQSDVPQRSRKAPLVLLGDILRSRKILLVVSGCPKRAVLKRLLDGPVSPNFPASLLWLHSDVTLICDRDAASR